MNAATARHDILSPCWASPPRAGRPIRPPSRRAANGSPTCGNGGADNGEPHVQLILRAADGTMLGRSACRSSELEGLPAAAMSGVASDVRFALTREAGVFRFQGSFDKGRGNGTFTFSASAGIHQRHGRARLPQSVDRTTSCGSRSPT